MDTFDVPDENVEVDCAYQSPYWINYELDNRTLTADDLQALQVILAARLNIHIKYIVVDDYSSPGTVRFKIMGDDSKEVWQYADLMVKKEFTNALLATDVPDVTNLEYIRDICAFEIYVSKYFSCLIKHLSPTFSNKKFEMESVRKQISLSAHLRG